MDTIFISTPNNVATSKAVASTVFASLGLAETEERFSANHPPDEHYFVGYAANVAVVVSDIDDDRLLSYPFALTLKRPTYRKGSTPISTEVGAIATTLSRAGLRAFVPAGAWHLEGWNGQGAEYAG